jgi:hypothetical protein
LNERCSPNKQQDKKVNAWFQCSIRTKYAIFDDTEVNVPRPTIATSEVSQFNGNVHHYFTVMPRSHTNRDKLRMGVVQVEKCELPKDFSGPPIGDRVLVKQLIEEGWSGACFSLLNFVVKCVNLLCKWVKGMVRYVYPVMWGQYTRALVGQHELGQEHPEQFWHFHR